MRSSARQRQTGSTVPRVFTPPLVDGPPGECGCGCALSRETSLGFSAVDFAEAIGIKPFPWQRWLMIHALELNPGGSFRYRYVLVLVARQNGKTSIVEIKNLWKMFVLGVPLVIGTAQNLDIAEESWDKAVEIIEGSPELRDELVTVNKVNGKKFFKLANGARWKVAAASRRGGRGLSGDDVNLDELREHQTWNAWGAVTKTTMAKERAQIWAFSNAGDVSSIVLNDLQGKGRRAAENPDGADPTLGLFEWSAPDDTKCTCNRYKGNPHDAGCALLDKTIQGMANPSAGHRGGVTWAALAAAAATDPDPIFLTECLCVRVPDLDGLAIDSARWEQLGDPESVRSGDVSLGVDISPERDWCAVSVYGHRSDARGHLQLAFYGPVAELLDKLTELRDAVDPISIGMGRATFNSLREGLRERGIVRPEDREEKEVRRGDLIVLSVPDMAAACGQLLDAVRVGDIRHLPATAVDDAVAIAKTKVIGGAMMWVRTARDVDITALVTHTVARWSLYARAGKVAEVSSYDPVSDIF